jgi:16S rRNA (cytidine1402-2'-O)-methyltransferase
MFEQIHRCALAEAGAWLAADPNRQRGEFVVLVEGAVDTVDDMAEARRLLAILLEACPVSQAAGLAAKITGLKKNALYAMALQMAGEDQGSD